VSCAKAVKMVSVPSSQNLYMLLVGYLSVAFKGVEGFNPLSLRER
jgi:hypothetical protein